MHLGHYTLCLLQVSRYELFKSVSTAIVFLFFKAFYFIWPALLFYFGNLIMVIHRHDTHTVHTYIFSVYL